MAFVSNFPVVHSGAVRCNTAAVSSACGTPFVTTLRRGHCHGMSSTSLAPRVLGEVKRRILPRMEETIEDNSNSTPQSSSSSSTPTASKPMQTPGPTTPGQIQIDYDIDSPRREVILDENIVGFCSIDPNTGKRLELTLREKEALFIDAVQAFFREEDKVLSDEEFDTLKEELTWQGSEVVTLDRDEFKFLDAARAYEQGKPTMDDKDFDKLKKKLFAQGSIVAIQRGPRCSIQRQLTFSDVVRDKKRTFALYVPAGLLMALTWLSVAFELTPLHRVDPVVSLAIGSPIIFIAARVLTGLVVPGAEIMVGDCPSCGRRTHVLFGNVLNQKGFSTEADVKCDKCKAGLKVEKETSRMILVKEGGK